MTRPADRRAILVSHGQPSAPGEAEAALDALRSGIAAEMQDRPAPRAATLAAAGALEAALKDVRAPVIYPLFMADGWFTTSELPRRLSEAGAGTAEILPPFGMDRAIWDLAAQICCEAAEKAGWDAADTMLLLAAHGSGRSRRPAAAARDMADHIARTTAFDRIRLGFIEEAPHLADAARGIGATSLCLPLFAAGGEHVQLDIPQALDEAGFAGLRLKALGHDPRVPARIATRLCQALSADLAISAE